MRCGLAPYHTSTSHYEAPRSMHLQATHSNAVDKSLVAKSGKTVRIARHLVPRLGTNTVRPAALCGAT